ncbi:unnamed protein product [Vitrella brassicaformis CCMP3155]|uniref:Bestrophin homolog n=2 Tax=Vitrella brassicaformis TaxID=1169539 RepID=A0A0G4GH08_VITBC|nr:unnamed protein product [Vitrella brassicaformis CCMP3155]|eukprot:CEM28903.1 unnamed protein product [Vitrella brassicaformis CCMP3155]
MATAGGVDRDEESQVPLVGFVAQQESAWQLPFWGSKQSGDDGYVDERHKGVVEVDVREDRREWIDIVDEHRPYNLRELNSLAGVLKLRGSVLMYKQIWIEALFYYLLVAAVVGIYLAIPDEWVAVEKKSTAVQNLATWLSALSGFLVGLYTSGVIDKWKELRVEGIGKIFDATTKLNFLLLSHIHTYTDGNLTYEDERTIDTIVRYGRVSLASIFVRRSDRQFHDLVKRGLLTEAEYRFLLDDVCYRVPCCVWAWVVALIGELDQKGRLTGLSGTTFLYETASDGRDGAAFILRQLAAPLPFAYVHMMAFLVKVNNIVFALAVSMRITRYLSQQGHWELFALELVLVFVIPFLYNGILTLAQELSDPFANEANDYPGELYDKYIARECYAAKQAVKRYKTLRQTQTRAGGK